jgi:hypothetical protein
VLGAILIILFELQIIQPDFVAYISPKRSPYPPGSAEDREYHLKILIPIFIMFTKIAVNILFQLTYMASFVDDSIFPFLKRSTAIGICNFFARIATIFAPFAADTDKPIPEIILILVVALAFVVAFTLPLEDYDDEN